MTNIHVTLLYLAMTACLLSACKGPSPLPSSQAATLQQKATADVEIQPLQQHCCRRAARGSNR